MSIDPSTMDEDLASWLADWVAKNCGGFVRSASLVVDLIDTDGSESWIMSELPGQSLLITAGLSDLLATSVRANLKATLDSAEEED